MERLFTCFRKKLGYERSVYGLLSSHVNGGRVLSIGCGQGEIERLLEKRNSARIEGVEVTKYREQMIKTTLYDGKRLPFRDREFDTSIFVYMLHHTKNIEELVSEAARVTNGTVIILDHIYTDRLSRLMLKAYDYLVNFPYRMPIPFNFLRIGEWNRLFEKLGLEVMEASIPSSMNVFFKVKARRGGKQGPGKRSL